MIRKLLVVLGIAVLVACAMVALVAVKRAEAPSDVAATVRAEALPATIEVADTPAARTQGLSGRESVPDDYGMLFVFDFPDEHSFWMKDMQVPIDIIWISEEGRIVYITHELAPDTYPTQFAPPAPARYVLETRAGYARERGWEIGTQLDLSAYAK